MRIITRFDTISLQQSGEKITVGGFVHSIRDHGGLLFFDIRSNNELIQCVFEPNPESDVFTIASSVSVESVVSITGVVRMRSEETKNPKLVTGDIEVLAQSITQHSRAKVLPFDIHATSEKLANEDLRLQYRYIDLRREKLHKQLKEYHQLNLSVRNWFAHRGFTEIATPILANSSPEGARDFLVPSRLHPGRFYALPQSPQQFKQLLMIGGFDKYFQIAPCFRDEDPRSDRHPGDFYHYDAEVAWAEEEDILQLNEALVREVFSRFTTKKLASDTFARISYSDAMNKYGSDKPDMRFGLAWRDVKPYFKYSRFTVFSELCESENSRVQALVIPGATDKYTRSDLDKIQDIGRSFGLPGIAYIQYNSEGPKSPIFKFFGDNQEEVNQKVQELIHFLELQVGDLVVFLAHRDKHTVFKAQHAIRTHIAEKLKLIDDSILQFVWIEQFPFFEYDQKTSSLTFGHNPFSSWIGGKEALEKAKNEGVESLLQLTARQYDIAVNGYEVLSGGVRNQDMDALKLAFTTVGYSEDQVISQFGHMLEAYSYGAPPHAGFAWGAERLFMVLQGEENIREIIAFPKNGSGMDVMMNSPSQVNEKQLKELNIQISRP